MRHPRDFATSLLRQSSNLKIKARIARTGEECPQNPLGSKWGDEIDRSFRLLRVICIGHFRRPPWRHTRSWRSNSVHIATMPCTERSTM